MLGKDAMTGGMFVMVFDLGVETDAVKAFYFFTVSFLSKYSHWYFLIIMNSLKEG